VTELFNNFLKLLVVVVAACVAIRLAYDAVRPALPVIGILIVVVVVVRVIAWYRDRW
jgi:predicted signal transduction protein with EAL and GGDEF domain